MKCDNVIEKLQYISGYDDDNHYEYPDKQEMVNTINNLIDIVNKLTKK